MKQTKLGEFFDDAFFVKKKEKPSCVFSKDLLRQLDSEDIGILLRSLPLGLEDRDLVIKPENMRYIKEKDVDVPIYKKGWYNTEVIYQKQHLSQRIEVKVEVLGALTKQQREYFSARPNYDGDGYVFNCYVYASGIVVGIPNSEFGKYVKSSKFIRFSEKDISVVLCLHDAQNKAKTF